MILLLLAESVGKVYSDVVDLSKSPSIPLFLRGKLKGFPLWQRGAGGDSKA